MVGEEGGGKQMGDMDTMVWKQVLSSCSSGGYVAGIFDARNLINNIVYNIKNHND